MAVRARVENPILTKELRTRMRGSRAFWILFTYLGALSVILFITYLSWWQSQRGNFASPGSFTVGKMFYSVLFSVQALLVGLITPALTSGAVSIEREQRTFEMLSVSLLPRRSIVVGKLVSAVAFIALLLTSSLPLVSLTFLLGGVSPGEVATSYALLVLTAFVYGAVGVAWSAVARSTTTATVMSYGTILLLAMLTMPLTATGVSGFYGGGNGVGGSGVLTAINPGGAMIAGTARETYFGVLTLPAWVTAFLVNGLLGTILTVVAIHRLEYPRTDRSPLLRGLVAVFTGLLAFFLSGAAWPSFGSDDIPTVLGMVMVLAPCLFVPVFATGEGLPEGLRGWRRLRQGQPLSGFVYVLLLTLLCGAMLLMRPLAFATDTFGPTLALILLTLSIVFGFGAMGLLLSAVTNNRWSALALTLSAMVFLYLFPFGAVLRNGGVARSTVFDNVLYLSPLPAAAEISIGKPATHDLSINPRNLLFGETPFWAVTPLLYIVIGFACLAQTRRVAAYQERRRRQREQQVTG